LNTSSWSKDGFVEDQIFTNVNRSLFAYALSQCGSEWVEARIRKVATGEDYPETLKWLKFTSLSFTNDNKGLVYSRYPEPGGIREQGITSQLSNNVMVETQIDDSY
jgi:prolyl oligopeptidase